MGSYRFLNLNIYKGKFLEKVIDFVDQEEFDLVHFQEASGGSISNHAAHDDFGVLTQQLGLQGKLAAAMGLQGEPQAYFGNATFYHPKKLNLVNTQILRLSPYREIANYPNRRIEDDPRCALILTFRVGNQELISINTHLAWGPRPDDKPYKLKQAQILIDYVKQLKQSFILSGDFNVTSDSQIVQSLNQIARNVTLEEGITNTLNPNIHRVKSLFPPGLLVDFVYVSPEIKVTDFEVKPVDLSDHYPSIMSFTLSD